MQRKTSLGVIDRALLVKEGLKLVNPQFHHEISKSQAYSGDYIFYNRAFPGYLYFYTFFSTSIDTEYNYCILIFNNQFYHEGHVISGTLYQQSNDGFPEVTPKVIVSATNKKSYSPYEFQIRAVVNIKEDYNEILWIGLMEEDLRSSKLKMWDLENVTF